MDEISFYEKNLRNLSPLAKGNNTYFEKKNSTEKIKKNKSRNENKKNKLENNPNSNIKKINLDDENYNDNDYDLNFEFERENVKIISEEKLNENFNENYLSIVDQDFDILDNTEGDNTSDNKLNENEGRFMSNGANKCIGNNYDINDDNYINNFNQKHYFSFRPNDICDNESKNTNELNEKGAKNINTKYAKSDISLLLNNNNENKANKYFKCIAAIEDENEINNKQENTSDFINNNNKDESQEKKSPKNIYLFNSTP